MGASDAVSVHHPATGVVLKSLPRPTAQEAVSCFQVGLLHVDGSIRMNENARITFLSGISRTAVVQTKLNLPIRSPTEAIIPAAGLGSRLLSVTKEQPKEMLPVYSKGPNDELVLKPVVQLIFEQLHDFGARRFCFVVGRGKRAIEDHFSPDEDFIRLLRTKGKRAQASQLLSFYSRIRDSHIVWMNQSSPLGFGHAVLTAMAVPGAEDVIVHAGDTQIISGGANHLQRMMKVRQETGAEAVLLLKKVSDPRQFGVAQVGVDKGSLIVRRVVEKPEKPVGKLAIMPIYVFGRAIFDALESVKPGRGGELQLTDGIQRLINEGRGVRAVTVKNTEHWLDVGTPETYWNALKDSHGLFSGGR